jgi:hypothetical protein
MKYSKYCYKNKRLDFVAVLGIDSTIHPSSLTIETKPATQREERLIELKGW